VAAAYSYFNLGESSSSSDDEDYSPEDWKKVRDVSLYSVLDDNVVVTVNVSLRRAYR